MPPAIREWLAEVVERAWSEPAPVVAAIPSALPAGRVQRLAGGGPFGLMFDGRLDEIDEQRVERGCVSKSRSQRRVKYATGRRTGKSSWVAG